MKTFLRCLKRNAGFIAWTAILLGGALKLKGCSWDTVAWVAFVPGGMVVVISWLFETFVTQKPNREPVGTMHHPVLGLTQLMADNTWESNQIMEPGKPPVSFSSLSGNREPTDEDVAAIEKIRGSRTTLEKAAFDVLQASCKGHGITLSPEDLRLESVVLTNSKDGAFTLSFDAPERQKELPWGLYADFAAYEVCEADVLH